MINKSLGSSKLDIPQKHKVYHKKQSTTSLHHKPRFYDIAVRLVLGTEKQGVVQVHRHGSWQMVCDDGWKKESAQVLCRQLNYADGRTIPHSAFGRSTEDITIQSIQCTGAESTLDGCIIVEGETQNETCQNYASAYCSDGMIVDSRE